MKKTLRKVMAFVCVITMAVTGITYMGKTFNVKADDVTYTTIGTNGWQYAVGTYAEVKSIQGGTSFTDLPTFNFGLTAAAQARLNQIVSSGTGSPGQILSPPVYYIKSPVYTVETSGSHPISFSVNDNGSGNQTGYTGCFKVLNANGTVLYNSGSVVLEASHTYQCNLNLTAGEQIQISYIRNLPSVLQVTGLSITEPEVPTTVELTTEEPATIIPQTINIGSFSDLSSAVTYANTNRGTYIFNITNDFTIGAEQSVTLEYGNVTLKGNGHTIGVNALINEKHFFMNVLNNATLTLGIGDDTNTLQIVDATKREDLNEYHPPRIKVSSLININSGSTLGVGFSIAGTLNMYGGELSGIIGKIVGSTSMYFGISAENVIETYSEDDNPSNAEINLYGGEISGNIARAVYIEGGSNCTVQGASESNPFVFENNKVSSDGAGIYFMSTGYLTVEYALFDGNHCTKCPGKYVNDIGVGAGIYASNNENINISNSIFNNNLSESFYANIPDVQGTLVFDNCNVNIIDCEIEENGWGVEILGDSVCEITGTTMNNNNSPGLFIYGTVICNVINSEITGNLSGVTGRGGGVCVNYKPVYTSVQTYSGDPAIVTFDDDTIICNNTATSQSADVYALNAILTLPDAAGMGQNFGDTGIAIDGWYFDGKQVSMGPGSQPRYGVSYPSQLVEDTSDSTKEYSLIAAYCRPRQGETYVVNYSDNLTGILDFDTGVYSTVGTGTVDWNYAFTQGCSTCVEKVVVNEGVIGIAFRGLAGMPNMTEVDLPDSLETIGEMAFHGDSSLSSIIIPDNVTTIGSSAFLDCANLSYVYLPDNISSISANAFEGCSGNLLISVLEGSYAEQYCIDNNINYTTDRTIPSPEEPTTEEPTSSEPEADPNFVIAKKQLALTNGLRFYLKADKTLFTSGGYTNPTMVIEFNNGETVVEEYVEEAQYYAFPFNEIAPHQMGYTFSATLHAYKNGVEYVSPALEYSVAQYCYDVFDAYKQYTYNQYAKLYTLLVDLLNYGAQAQIYTGTDTDNLVNADLTAEQQSHATTLSGDFVNSRNYNYETIANPSVTWQAAALNLRDSIVMRLRFAAASTDGLVVKARDDKGNEWEIDAEAFESAGSGTYNVYFDQFNVGRMSDIVYLTVYNGDTPVSNTCSFSIESYAAVIQQNASTYADLNALTIAMMKYGKAAKAYTS